jgi:hypothetical protein
VITIMMMKRPLTAWALRPWFRTPPEKSPHGARLTKLPDIFVSRQLVEYRIKVTHLWAEYKDTSAVRAEHV